MTLINYVSFQYTSLHVNEMHYYCYYEEFFELMHTNSKVFQPKHCIITIIAKNSLNVFPHRISFHRDIQKVNIINKINNEDQHFYQQEQKYH